MTDLSIGRRTVKIAEDGDSSRPAIILSHSLGADLTMWDGQVSALAEHFRVIRYDSRGHGGSEGGEAVSVAALGGDVLAVLDALGIETAHFLGLSMGGAVGLWLLANAPHRIERAVLANTAARIGTPDSWNARILSVLTNGMNETADAAMERWFSADFTARDPARVDEIRRIMRTSSPEGYAACCAALRDLDLRDRLKDIRREILVISGNDDPVVPNPDVEAVVAATGAKHVALQARHLSNIEAEAAFNAAVIHFLTAKAPARRTTPKPAPPKSASVKRGGAGRRSNAARNPLKTPTVKRAAKKTATRAAAGRATKARVEARRRPAERTGTTRRATAKTPAPKPAVTRKPTATRKATKGSAKSTTKSTAKTLAKVGTKAPARTKGTAAASARTLSTTRGKAPSAAARAPVKKTKATKAKAPAKKIAARNAGSKTAAKTTPKKAPKTVAKTAPTGRRKATAKPRRPIGRKK